MKKTSFRSFVRNKSNKEKNYIYLKSSLIFLILFSYFFGFYLRENIAGGAEADFNNFTWKGILSFKNNFLDVLYNYGKIGEGSLPLFHILNAYFNPFTYNKESFQLSISFLSLLNVIFFSQILRQKYKIKILDSYLYSSIFLILPFFRSSAFWGLTENLGWLFLILTIKYYLVVEKNKINIFLVCLFSSLALYTRPFLVFFPIFFIINLFFKKDYLILKNSIFYYGIFAIPGLILLYIWGGSVYLGSGEDKVNILEHFQPKFIIKNLVIFSSIFLFYLLPFHLVSFSTEKKIDKNKKIYYLIILIFLLILYYLNVFDYLKDNILGGGVFLKISQLFFNDNNFLFIIIAFFGIISIIYFLEISKKNFILIFCILIIYCTAKNLYQEYFEPLLLIALLSLFDLKNPNIKVLKDNKTVLKFLFYFSIYFFSSYYYRYNISTI